MTEDFVPFESKLYFESAPNIKSDKGTLIFRKDFIALLDSIKFIPVQ